MTILQTLNSIDQALFQTIVNLGDKSGKCHVILDASFQIVYQSESHQLLTGLSIETIGHQHFSKMIGNSKSQEHIEQLEHSMRAGEMFEMTLVHKKFQQLSFSGKMTSIPFQNSENETIFVLLLIEDVTMEKLKHSLLRLEQNILQTIDQGIRFEEKLEQICHEMNYIFDPHCLATIAWLHQDQLYLYTDSQKDGQTTQIIRSNDVRYHVYHDLIQSDTFRILTPLSDFALDPSHLDHARSHHFDRAFAIPLELTGGEKKGAIILYYDDITRDTRPFYPFFEKLTSLVEFAYNYERQKEEMYNLAYYDPTLHIPNRHGMLHFMNKSKATLAAKQLSVVLLSPSEYIKVIELYGRDSGEIMLKEIMNRIKNCDVYDIVLIGRFSSSTLYVVVAGDIDYSELSQHLTSKMSAPMIINNRTIYMTVRSGVASQKHGDCIDETCRQAEIALSQARKKGGYSLGMYDEQYTLQIEKELSLLNHLTEAINNKEIQVYFQPKVELHRGRVESMEALARWISPKLGFISPGEFIPVAEKNGLIRKIDLLMIEQVLIWMQQRQYNGQKIVPVSVNISAEHFYHPDFIDRLKELVQQYYADPKYLVIEITETLGLEDLDRAHMIINRLNVLGFIVSVDDFGIGYSSLSYLQKLHFSELKIDMSFVKRLDEVGTRAIVRSIIDIAKNMEMRVVAEGVETEEQAELLKTLGCDVAQGYLFYKPMPMDALDF